MAEEDPPALAGAAARPAAPAEALCPSTSETASRAYTTGTRVGLRCAGNSPCVGQLLLQNAAAGGARLINAHDAAARKPTTYGKVSFRIAAHRRKTLAIHLSSVGKKLLSRHRPTKAWANVKLSSGLTKRYSIPITLHG